MTKMDSFGVIVNQEFYDTHAHTHTYVIFHMTIDSGWVRIMKEECPEAFRSTYPFKGRPKVAYIDGMPLLMISEGRVQSWQDLLINNFARHVTRYFRLGCSVVVLAFDDYGRFVVCAFSSF